MAGGSRLAGSDWRIELRFHAPCTCGHVSKAILQGEDLDQGQCSPGSRPRPFRSGLQAPQDQDQDSRSTTLSQCGCYGQTSRSSMMVPAGSDVGPNQDRLCKTKI